MSAAVVASGFSTSTCLPAAQQRWTWAACWLLGEQIHTASTRSSANMASRLS